MANSVLGREFLNSIEVVNFMDLEVGHKLTQQECEAITELLRDAINLQNIKRALGMPDDA